MAASAVVRKSVTDLTRRPARTALTLLTLAIAVASVGIFGTGPLMQRAMEREIASAKLADLTVATRPLPIDAQHVDAIAQLPNVVAVQPKTLFSTRVLIGDRRQRALIVTVPDLAHQRVDRIHLRAGTRSAGALLTERQNSVMKKFEGAAGSSVRIIAADGRPATIPISGEAHYLGGGGLVSDGGFAVFYAAPSVLRMLRAPTGTTMLAMRLRDTSRPAAQRTAEQVRRVLRDVPGFDGFADLPEIRAAGDYPGKTLFGQVTTLMTLITALALLSALVLVGSTMSTLVGEQTAEIGVMKAIGASRRDITRIYRRTALLLGLFGGVLGTALGLLLANGLVAYFGSRFYGIAPGFDVAPTTLVASLLVGVAGPPLAAIPAVRRAGRVPIVEALNAGGGAVGAPGRVDAALRRITWPPRTAQVGIRGAARRKRRTAATTLQVALAVATLLALLSLGRAVGNLTHGFYDASRWDIWVSTIASKSFTPGSAELVRSIPGVTAVQGVLTNQARAADTTAQAYGLTDEPMYAPELVSGRWFTPAESRARQPVAIVGRALADRAHASVGGPLRIRTASGTATVRVLGISTNVLFQGAVVFMPLASMQRALGTSGAVNTYWVATDHGGVADDGIAKRIEDAMARRGTQVTTTEKYLQERENAASNAAMTNAITVLGFLIVAISLVGLANAITMGVIERTREIGMLRSIGARAADVRAIFRAEGLLVAGLGWLVGIPLGWLLAHGLVAMTASVADTDLDFVFPLEYVALTLPGTVLLAIAVLWLPIRRAVGLRPGDALRSP